SAGADKPGWGINLLVVFLIIMIFIPMSWIPRLEFVPEANKDPENLSRLITKYLEDFKKLGTPRKIKRFMNKVRLQYFMLEGKSLLMDYNYRLLFMNILYVMEINDIVPKLKCNDYEEALKEFKKALREYGIFMKFDESNDSFELRGRVDRALIVPEHDIPKDDRANKLIVELFELNRGNLI
ncbi:MAG TPA: hypothetical protein VN922_07820, partial [Bacteroidia bacterium]|nr:hypothetical protein [Bacteroidia bacterium]